MPSAVAFDPLHPAAAVARRFGRFTLRQLLGHSVRSLLWLAEDESDRRELLLGMPRSAPADRAARDAWLADARRAARLSHPRLARVAEVGVHGHEPYLAFDRGSTRCLSEWLAATPAPPAHGEVAGWLCQALEGLAYAHEAGVVHGDLQLHHLLIDERGQVSLVALSCVGDEGLGGVRPAASRGLSMDPLQLRMLRAGAERDVLACGLLAHHLLSGTAAFDEEDSGRAIERLPPLGREVLRLPWTTPQPVAEALRAIVNRATHHQPRQRYLNARSLLRALDGWRIADARDSGGPIALLLDRLATVGHLPALPGVAAHVARLSRTQHGSVLAEQVLLDLALSFELLRQVNTAQVQMTQAAGNGPVLTVRRAIAMLGLDGVRSAAAGLRAWPGPLAERAAVALHRLIQRVRWAGHLAQRLRPAGYDPEVVFLLAVLQNLGRLLLHYHFADDAEQIAQLMRPVAGPDGAEQPGMSEAAAASAVLGVDPDAITLAVARHWGLPEEALHLLRRLPGDRPVRAAEGDADVLRATVCAANEAIDAIADATSARASLALDAIVRRYARVLGVNRRDLNDALRAARESLEQDAPPLFEPTAPAPLSGG